MKFFTLEKIARQLPEIQAAIAREVHPLRRIKHHAGDVPGAARPDFDDNGWEDFDVGDEWGGYDQIAWFRASLVVPPRLRDQKLALRLVAGPGEDGASTVEAMLYVDGVPLQGIDVWHDTAWLPPEVARRGELTVALRAWCGVWRTPDRRRFRVAQLEWIDADTEAFYFLADTLHKAVQALDADDLRRARLLEALNNAFLRIDFTMPRTDAFYASVAGALAYLDGRVQAWRGVGELKPRVIAVGHAHLDLAWLWRWRHTRDKAQRTFATVLNLMRQYPEYRFMHSTPYLYQQLKADAPELFAQVKDRIAAGVWEITGGMWVEADTNLPSGESLVRQILWGTRFTHAEFGRETNILWLPDVFGYSAALPQIMKKSGLRFFLTTKISWSQFNRFPYDTFLWRGLDGSEVLAHFVTTPSQEGPYYTYNGRLDPAEVQALWAQYRQKDLNDELLHLFGWGDGGGGPTQAMLETARVLRNLPGMPAVQMGRAEPYFDRLARRLADSDLPRWDGELYLEYHRGTYTSQAFNKRANRQAERLFHTAEWLCVLAETLTGRAACQPAALRRGWELILFNQFHDILPGSAIAQVYQDSRADYAEVSRIGTQVVETARNQLLPDVATTAASLVAFNALGWSRGGLATCPAAAGQPAPVIRGSAAQKIELAGVPYWLIDVPPVPALGYQAFALEDGTAPVPAVGPLTITPRRLENGFYRLELNERGQIVSLFDKRRSREVLAPGARGNVFQTFEDKPMNFDAWDVDLYYQEKAREIDELLEASVEEVGPLRGTLRLRWRFHESTITQRLSLYHNSPRIDFRTGVDWRARQVLLKVAFPVAVRATRATYEIQFGSVERPTHWNTSWDLARFEVVGHQWVDLSEGDYGVALLNDCKYGHDVKDNVLRLTLIKSPIEPDPLADQGHHEFTYSLLPHAGDWRAGGVLQEAYALNTPLLADLVPAQPHGGLPPRFELAAVDAAQVVIETVKPAEAGDAWVIRVYEAYQTRVTTVSLDLGRPIRRAVECNLIEEGEQPVAFAGRRLTFPILPFEIKTFKVWLAPP
jgi:alpha-mannosidase